MTPGIYNLGTRVITAALTDQVITEGSSTGGTAQSYIDRLDGMSPVTLFVEFDWGSGGTSCAVIVETSLNAGDDWVEIAEFDFTTADSKKTANISATAAAAVASVMSSFSIVSNTAPSEPSCRSISDWEYSGPR